MVEEGFSNPCCITLKQKYTKLKEQKVKLEQRRKYLRECVDMLEPGVSKLQADNLTLEKACQDEKKRADLERKEKEKESAMRVTLENQLDALKIECQMLQQNDSSSSQNLNGDVQRLVERILEGGKEINMLKELIQKEKLRADVEKKRADAEKKKRAECEGKRANDALTKVKEDKKLTDLERKNSEENIAQLEALKTELAQVKLNLEETVKQLEIERLRADSEKKRAESEKNKADEALKKVKEDKRDVNDDSNSSEEYRVQLEVLKAEIVQVKSNFEKTKNQLVIEKTRADAEKKRAESVRNEANEAEKKVKEAARLADVEIKKSEESRVQLDVLMAEKFQLKTYLEETKKQLEKEKTRADAEKRRAESVRNKANEAEKEVKEDARLADVERKKSEESRVQLDVLMAETFQLKTDLEETKTQLEKEKTRADAEKKRADAEKQRAESVRNKANEAEKKVKEDARLADVERKKSEECRVQLDVLMAEKFQLKTGLEGTKKQLEIEKTRADAEKKRAESVRNKANEEEKKVKENARLADVQRKKSEESRVQLDVLMAEKFQLKIDLEETKKQLEKEKTRANKEKKRADADNKIYESERKKTNEAEKKIEEVTGLADVERKKSKESRVQLEALKMEFIEVKSILEETKKQLEKEKTRADAEKKRAESERKKGSEAVKKIKEDNRLSDVEKRKSKENKSQLEVLKTGTVGVKEISEENKSEHVNGRGKSRKRKKCGELAVIEGYDQSNVTEIYWKKAIDEKCRADTLTLQLEKEKERNLELEREISELVTFEKADQQKSGNANKQPTKEKHLVEQLYQEVDNNKHRIQEMQSVIENLLSSKNFLSSPASIKNLQPESAKIKSLRKKVKFEKMMVKHAKQVAELEVGRNNILQYELGRLKQEILKFSENLDILDNPAFKSDAGIAGHGKLCSLPLKRKHSHERPHPTNLFSSQEPTRLCSTCNAAYSKYNVKCSALSLPLHEGCSGETISGINSKLECLHRGCNQLMLQSSAINSCSTSFSNRLSVGSQEDGAFPITTSTNFSEENLNSEQFPTRLTDGLTTSFIHHSHTIAIQKNNRDDNRNKESHDTVEAIRNLTSEGRTTCQPHNLSDLSFPEKGSLIPVLQGKLCNEDFRSSKRRKEISEEHMVRAAPESRSSPPASIGIWKNGINDLLSNPEVSGSCNGLDLSNIMRLFDLDNEEDERSFCAAMERPLSPSLPVLELKHHNTADARGSEDSLDNNFHVGRSTVHGDAAKCGTFDVIEVEIDSNKRSKSCFGNSTRQQLEKPDGVIIQNRNLDGFEKADNSQITDLRFCRNGESSPQISDIVTIGKESHGLLRTDVSLTCSSLPRYLIVYPDIKDAASISRICGAVGRCMSHCTMISSSSYVKESLIIIAKDEGLSSKEKVCTFVTAILQKINEDMIMNSGTSAGSDIFQFIDAFSSNLNAVLSDIKMKKIMMDLWDLSDLLNIVEDFLINRRALLFGDASSNIIKSATLDGNGKILHAQEAPISLLVAGGVLLATICTSFDDVGFVSEVSYQIMRTQKSNSSLVLIILHVFAHICGPKYFEEEFGLVVNVIRSLVVYLERRNSSCTISSCFPSLVEAPYNPWSCCNCPFLHDSSSTDVVVSLLLKELHIYITNSIERLDHLDPINLAKYGKNMFGMDKFKDAQVKTACENFDVFSLLELVAGFMSWDWSFDYIVCPVLEMLESCPMDFVSAALITFLGQLGRIGVEAHGYDDAKVENLRSRFSAFLTRTAMGNSGFLVQLASATALSGLTLSFEELVNSDCMIPATAVSLKNWFFSLNKEQQSSCKMELFSCPRE